MNVLRRLVPLLFLPILLASCLHEQVEDFYFIEYSGLRRPLLEEPSLPAGEEGRLLPRGEGSATPFYRLKQSVRVEEPDRAFFIVYTADCPLILKIRIDGEFSFTSLPLYPGRQIEYRLPLPPQATLEGFQLETESAQGDLRILGTGVEDLFPGARVTEELVVIGQGIGLERNREGIELHIDSSRLIPGDGGYFRLDLAFDAAAPVAIEIADEETRLPLTLNPRPGVNRLDIYPGVIGFDPRSVRISGAGTSVELFGLERLPPDLSPVSIDFASLLRYPVAAWRDPDFELFRWNVAPEVLVFDFRDYGVQADFLKRLAFFVEKDGFSGTLLSDDELEGRHGWNAHDYRAEDLARFFSRAEGEEFPLSEGELRLKEILIANGVISPGDGAYRPGVGAIISITRESDDYLRDLFLTHEGFHALFFVDPGFRARSETLWSRFSEVERSFWRTFLSWKGYDPSNQYLVENELQAYLMQQSVERADPYYLDYTLPRLSASRASAAGVVDELMRRYPDHFTASARYLDQYLNSVWGLAAGDLENLKYIQ